MITTGTPDRFQRLISDADLCVKCGLCLPQCPTYGLSGHEADGPRGRIALVQALARGDLEPTPAAQTHLDGCLHCRACERACPADVPYGRLIDGGLSLMAERDPGRRRLARLVAAVLARPRLRRVLLGLMRSMQASGLFALVTRMAPKHRLGRLAARLPALSPRRASPPEQARPGAPEVWLAPGCLGEQVGHEAEAVDALRTLLEHSGYRVLEAPALCCGALSRHAGDTGGAARTLSKLVRAMPGDAPVVSPASGCGLWLSEASDDGSAAAGFSARLRDPWSLLMEAPHPPRFKTVQDTVTLHLPCTQHHVAGGADALRRMLGSVPGTELRVLPPGCCGAAGLHMVERPDAADALGDRMVATMKASEGSLLSANVGCRMHLASRLRSQPQSRPQSQPQSAADGLRAPPRHPATWLRARLVDADRPRDAAG